MVSWEGRREWGGEERRRDEGGERGEGMREGRENEASMKNSSGRELVNIESLLLTVFHSS